MENFGLHGNSSTAHSSDGAALVSRTVYTTVAVIVGVLSVLGILLNVLVIVVTVRHRQLRQPLNYALVNLAVCDLGCAMFGGLPTAVTSAMGYFSLGRIGCILEGFAVAFFGKEISTLCSLCPNKGIAYGSAICFACHLTFSFFPSRYSRSVHNSSHFC